MVKKSKWFPPSPAQWEAIRAVDRHALVVAGAGTGKTHTVVCRLLYLLGIEIQGERVDTPLSLDQLAAITFTNHAAADLKHKLREGLRYHNRADLAYEVDNARVGTIHSFCADVIREFALRSTHPFASNTFDEAQAATLRAEAVREALTSAVADGKIDGLDELLASWSIRKVREFLDTLLANRDRLLQYAKAERTDPREDALLALALQAAGIIEKRLAAERAVDFDAMILRARDLLRDDEPARRILRRRLRLLVVDEFQDVDPPQKEIAYLLGDPLGGDEHTTRLMLVGDPKQSIYRFRRADVTVWSQVQHDFEAAVGASLFHVEENYRSRPAILGFVEASVGKILGDESEALQPYEIPFRPLTPTRDEHAQVAGVEVLIVPPSDETDRNGNPKARNAGDVRAAEAAEVARRIRALHAEEITADEPARKVAWGDIAILLPTWGSLDTYAAALSAAGIPHFALLREDFYDRREIVDMLLALEVIRDPTDNRALVGFLRSPFVGVRDETLLALALAQGWSHYARLTTVECPESALLRESRTLIERYTRLRDRIPADALLRTLLQETGYLAHLALLGEDGMQALANVRKLLAILEEHRDLGMGDLIQLLRDSRELQSQEGDAILFGAREDVVTITSVHMAKGLEWPVVFWCDAIGEARREETKLLIGRDRFRLIDPDRKQDDQPEDYQRLKEELSAEAAAERKRLWYVASTRAKDLLVVSAIPLGKSRSAKTLAHELRTLFPALDSGSRELKFEGAGRSFVAAVRETAEPAAQGDVWDTEELPIESDSVVSLPIPPVEAPLGTARRSATEYLAFGKCPRRHWFKYVLGLREPSTESDSPRWGGALARGSIVHELLELAAENEDADHALEMSIGRWDPDAPPPETEEGFAYREELREEVDRVLRDERYAGLANAPGARRELSFFHIVDESLVLHGAIDLAAPVEGALRLLDVKTGDIDAAEAERRAEGYRVQREVYVAAAEALSGLTVSDFAFHFSGPGEHVSVPITDEVRSEAMGRIRAAATTMLAADPELTDQPYLCYRCGYKKVRWCRGAGATSAPDT